MNVEQLIAKLEREYLDTTDPKIGAIELGKREGWNLRNRAILFDLKADAALEELNAPVDTRLRDQMIKFDLGGEG